MAKIETTFIRPKELFTPDTGETKVVYDGYQNNPHELVVQENLESDVSEIVNDTFVPNEGGNVVFTDDNETEHELITEDGFAGALDTAMPTALAKAQVIETTWQELKDKRDNGELIAGSLYRITDYQCTTTQEDTRSAGHQFDIVLLALSEDKLAEEGWAMMNESNIYDVTFSDGVTKKCYLYCTGGNNYNVVDATTLLGDEAVIVGDGEDMTINEENKTAIISSLSSTESDNVEGLTYNYFQNSNLSAWKVWYCLDNDTARFAWADDSVDEGSPASIEVNGGEVFERSEANDASRGEFRYAWKFGDYVLYTQNTTPAQGDNGYFNPDGTGKADGIEAYNPPQEGTGLPNGRGVIYRLIDEWNNDVPYDFKNIQFVRPMTDGEYDPDNGEDTWVYTFCVASDGIYIDISVDGGIKGAVIDFCYELYNNVVLSPSGDYIKFLNNTYGCTVIGSSCITILASDDLVIEGEDFYIYLNNKKVLTES